MKKKILALVLATMMLVTMLPLASMIAFADGNEAKIVHADTTETPYATVEEAFAALADGETVVLLQDVAIEAALAAPTGVTAFTLDGASHAIAATGAYAIDTTANYTLKNVSISITAGAGKRVLHVTTSTVNIEDGVSLLGSNSSSSTVFYNDSTDGTATININKTPTFTKFDGQATNTDNKIIFNLASDVTVTASVCFWGAGTVDFIGGTFNTTLDLWGTGAVTKLGTYNVKNTNLYKIQLSDYATANVTNTVFPCTGTPTDIAAGTLNLGEGVSMVASAADKQLLRVKSPRATINVTGGTYTSLGGFMFGANSGNGDAKDGNHVTINISGGTFTSAGAMLAEWQSIAGLEMNISGGTFVDSGADMFIVKAAGTINVTGGIFTGADEKSIFNLKNDAAVLNVSGGTINAPVAGNSVMLNANATVTVSGDAIFNQDGTTGNSFNFGDGNEGILNISGGTFNDNNDSFVLRIVSSKPTVTISGGTFNGKATTANFVVCRGAAKIDITGGTFALNCGNPFLCDDAYVINISGGSFTFDWSQETDGSRSLGFKFEGSINSDGVMNIYGGSFVYAAAKSAQSTFKTIAGTAALNVYGGYFKAVPYAWHFDTSNTGKITLYGGTFETIDNQDGFQSKVVRNAGAYYHNGAPGSNNAIFFATMKEGASVRLVENSNGIRFESTFEAARIEALAALKDESSTITYGTLIMPTATVTSDLGGVFTFDVLNNAGKVAGTDYLNIVAQNGISTDGANNVTIRAALVNIKAANVTKEFSAVGYIAYKVNGVTCYAYTAYTAANNSRSLKQAATAALADQNITWSTENTTILQGYAA